MKKELELKLVNLAPKMYAGYYGSTGETPMARGFEVSDGWYSILEELTKNLMFITEAFNVDIIVVQVKEKFGALSFYNEITIKPNATIGIKTLNKIKTLIHIVINYAVTRSNRTCEICGDQYNAKSRRGNWVQTLCDECYAKLNIKESEEG